MNNKPVRVRIAPSPTGDPTVGTAYMGLFNYVFAHHSGGQFILRIEDTDRTRFQESSADAILEAFDWLNVSPDEGPGIGGDVGPYIQSERLDIYRKYIQQLVDEGHAYHCFCSKERLAEMRAAQEAHDLTCSGGGHRRQVLNRPWHRGWHGAEALFPGKAPGTHRRRGNIQGPPRLREPGDNPPPGRGNRGPRSRSLRRIGI